MALLEAVVYLAYTVVDNAYRRLYGLVQDDGIIDTALVGVVVGGFLQAGEDEDIEIGNIFVRDMALGVCFFLPLVTGV